MDRTTGGAYYLMQETAGHYSQFRLAAGSPAAAVHFAGQWHSTHAGQTVVTREESSGRIRIVAVLG